MGFVVEGARIVLRNERLRRASVVPVVSASVVYVVLFLAGWIYFTPVFASLAEGWGVPQLTSQTLGMASFVIAWWFLSGLLFVSLAGAFSSLVWDAISQDTERAVGIDPPNPRLGFRALAWDFLLRVLFSLAVGIGAVIFGWCTMGIAGIALTGWAGLYNYTAPASMRRGILFPRQFSEAHSWNGWFGFALLSGIVALFPLVNVLLFPVFVAGGTLLAVQSERQPSLAHNKAS
ncbi:MAG: EI24 domain-containing protein [Fimbriimonadaceae bacterium]|nr:hypothetical protein [Fimbriimonadaceae bacterium]MCZ7580974.1 EI24 domain-containing protein [Fimbriimonadaceae bacterium]